MCTAVYLGEAGLFGRTLDFEKSFGEQIVLTPREYMVMGEAKNRYSILGTGVVSRERVLYFDGLNEWGLSGAALNFPGYAAYRTTEHTKAKISASVFLSFVLGFCKSIHEVKDLFLNISICGEPISSEVSITPLHWIFADGTGSVVVESVDDGLKVYDNPYGVLTNSPDFNYHVTRLADFAALRADCPEKRLTDAPLNMYSRGLGAVGLPGDFSSCSRFIRAVFLKENTRPGKNKNAEVIRMCHILSALSVPLGCVITKDGKAVSTIYKSVCDGENLTYYFSTYGNSRLRCVKLIPEIKELLTFNMCDSEGIPCLN